MVDTKNELLAAGCPPELAAKLTPKVGAKPEDVGAIFGNLQFIRKLLALWQQDGTIIKGALAAIIALKGGDFAGFLAWASANGPAAWAAIQDILDLFGVDLNPAPAAA